MEFVGFFGCGAWLTVGSPADESAVESCGRVGWTKSEMDREVGIEGVAGALPPGWIQIKADGTPQVPDYTEHNGTSPNLRAADSQ